MNERQVERAVRRMVAEFPAPQPGFEDRVLSALPADRRRPRQGWATAAAVGIAVIVVATLVLGGRQLVGRRPVPAMPPASHPSATPATPDAEPTPLHVQGRLTVPDSEAVIAFGDPDTSGQIDAIPWSAQHAGTTGARVADRAAFWSASPDGALYEIAAGGVEIVDRLGNVIHTLPRTDKALPTWADDSRHLCAVSAPAGGEGPATLELVQPGQPARAVAQVGRVGGQTGVSVRACGETADIAVVTQTGPIGNAVELWVVRLSTGGILFHETFPATVSGTTTAVAASRDGKLIAEMTAACCPTAPPVTVIRRAADGAVVGHLDGRWVSGFSWDGQLVVTSDQEAGGTLQLVRWQTGEVLWTGPAGTRIRAVLPEPDGQRLAVLVNHGPDPGAPLGDLWIVGPDGHAVLALAGIG